MFIQRYARNFLRSTYARLGHHTKSNDEHTDVLLRSTIAKWACDMELDECIDEAREDFHSWMRADEDDDDDDDDDEPDEDEDDEDDGYDIDVELRAQVYCTGVAQGGEEEWNFVWEKYLTNQVPSEQKKLLLALPCTKHIWLLNK